jgi:transposase-like protein
MKHNPKAITTAMQLYFSGESLRNTMKSLRLLGEVSHKTVFMWIKKYVKLMKEYAEKLVPNVGDTWRADEVYVKITGNMKYLFAMMDDETRFWIAQEVGETKNKHDARKLFWLLVFPARLSLLSAWVCCFTLRSVNTDCYRLTRRWRFRVCRGVFRWRGVRW